MTQSTHMTTTALSTATRSLRADYAGEAMRQDPDAQKRSRFPCPEPRHQGPAAEVVAEPIRLDAPSSRTARTKCGSRPAVRPAG